MSLIFTSSRCKYSIFNDNALKTLHDELRSKHSTNAGVLKLFLKQLFARSLYSLSSIIIYLKLFDYIIYLY